MNIYLQGFTMMFLSILLEAMPFVLLGTLVSSLIHLYLGEETLARLLPRNSLFGLLISSLLGFAFPVCECAIVPIVRGLLRKGVPVGMAVTFMLAVPIVNPVVLASTHYAFGGSAAVAFLRALAGIVIAIFVGELMGRLFADRNPLLKGDRHQHSHDCVHGHPGHNHDHAPASSWREQGILQHLLGVLQHTGEELFDIGRYLIIGAGLSAAAQTLVPRQWLLAIGQGELSSILVLMALAFLLSLCSEADAFIARTFVGQFTGGSILAFLVYGPMIDLKNVILLLGSFERRFVLRLVTAVSAAVLTVALLANQFGF